MMRATDRAAPLSPVANRLARRLALRTSLVVMLVATGCGDDAPIVQPSRDYTSEAESEIDETNMDAELRKLESEIEADLK